MRSLLALIIFAAPLCAAESDALAISRIIQARHFPSFTVLDPIFESPTSDRILSYTRCGDSAIWTGYYLAAESFRYKVTAGADALANARRAFEGIKALADVTGNNALARCLVPANSPYAQSIQGEEKANGIYRSSGNIWIGNTSRDQYAGALFGLGIAYDLIDDASLKTSIAGLVTRLVQFLKDHAWTVVLPDGSISTTFINRPDQQLAFLQLARHVNPDQFSTAYDIERVLLSPTVVAPISFDVLSDDSYFKFNLASINLYTLIHLESSGFEDIYRKAYDILRNHTDNQGNAFFNMIDRALNGPNPTRDAETRLLLNQWLQRTRRDPLVDNRGKYPACGNQACSPVPVPDRVTTDFIWQRSPFQLAGGDRGLIETAGIDYILPYWMGRYYGVIAADTVRLGSAASGAATLAPEAIASIFGANLATGTATVTVKDSASVARPAMLYFVSPAQINFVVPAGTALGIASITVQSPDVPDLTTSAEIRVTAPALFTADATGKGVVAATAVRVIANGQGPVAVFSCAGANCASLPIDTGVDAPVYVSLYGTGIRNRSSLAGVTCTVGGVSVPVLYAGPQPEFAGLDQVNIGLTLNLRGMGETDLIVSVDGVPSNVARINIQ